MSRVRIHPTSIIFFTNNLPIKLPGVMHLIKLDTELPKKFLPLFSKIIILEELGFFQTKAQIKFCLKSFLFFIPLPCSNTAFVHIDFILFGDARSSNSQTPSLSYHLSGISLELLNCFQRSSKSKWNGN